MGPGLALEIPLFGRHKGRLARAEAELEVEARRYVATRERIALEVRQARTALVAARESLAIWGGSVLPALEQSLARVEKAREAGDASLLERLAARRSVLDARLLEAEARAAERSAEAALGPASTGPLGTGTPPPLEARARESSLRACAVLALLSACSSPPRSPAPARSRTIRRATSRR
jgi:outer membrane protein TolC